MNYKTREISLFQIRNGNWHFIFLKNIYVDPASSFKNLSSYSAIIVHVCPPIPELFPTHCHGLFLLLFILLHNSFLAIISVLIHLMDVLSSYNVSFLRVRTSMLCSLFEPRVLSIFNILYFHCIYFNVH